MLQASFGAVAGSAKPVCTANNTLESFEFLETFFGFFPTSLCCPPVPPVHSPSFFLAWIFSSSVSSFTSSFLLPRRRIRPRAKRARAAWQTMVETRKEITGQSNLQHKIEASLRSLGFFSVGNVRITKKRRRAIAMMVESERGEEKEEKKK